MSARERRWNELQDRFAQGESLSAEEDSERRAYAEQDLLARRELELFAALRARAQGSGQPVPALVARALEGARATPRLRLVTSKGTEAEEARAPVAAAGPRSWRVAAGALLLAGVAATTMLATRFLRSDSAPPAAALLAPPLAGPARAELVLSAGEVLVAGHASLVGQRLLAERERVSTGNGRACLTIDPGIDVCLAEHSAIELDSLAASRVRVRVESGTALASLTARARGSSFALVAGNVTATAHGTTYAVRRAKDRAEVIVVEGEVEVARDGGDRELVDAHSRVVVPAPPAELVRTTVGRSEEAKLLVLRAPNALWTGASVGVLELAAGPPMQKASIDDEAALLLPLQAFVGAGVHRISWRDAAGAETTSWIELAAGETRRLSPPEPLSAVGSEPASGPSATALLERARRELTRGESRQALALYEQLRATYPASPEARTVLITMGKLELDLGHPKRALSHFEAYLRGGGSLTPEALAGQARSLRALGRAPEERRAIEQYLAAQPNGFDAPSFSKRLRELSRP